MRQMARPLSLVVVLLVLLAQAVPASASNTWSDTDPVVIITTPGGHMVPVYVNNGAAGAEHLPAAQLARMTYTTKSVGQGTKVSITSNVPCDALGTGWGSRTRPSTGAFGTGTLYGEAYGVCGQDLIVTFTLSVS
jgi:hypothetical protein